MTLYTEMWDKIENKYKDTYGPYLDQFKAKTKMVELALIGRAGYGLWQGGELFTGALIREGKYAKVIFLMPGERRNSPTRSYIRYADEAIAFPACDIYKPDHMIVAEPSMLMFQSQAFDIDVIAQTSKMTEKDLIIVNSQKTPEEVKKETGTTTKARIATVDASAIAIEYLGDVFHSNTALLGAYIKLTGAITLDAWQRSIEEYKDPRDRKVYAGEKGKRNMKATEAGYNSVKI